MRNGSPQDEVLAVFEAITILLASVLLNGP